MGKTVLAMDLSLRCPAFAVLDVGLTSKSIDVIHLSHVTTSSKRALGFRLWEIYKHLNHILKEYEIDEIIIEKGFNKFPTATAQLQRVVGVVTLCLYIEKGIENYVELTPSQVKKLVTGDGKADKQMVADALEEYVGEIEYKTDDESDAVGCGVALAKYRDWI